MAKTILVPTTVALLLALPQAALAEDAAPSKDAPAAAPSAPATAPQAAPTTAPTAAPTTATAPEAAPTTAPEAAPTTAPEAAPAASSGTETPAWETAPSTRRAGFSVGVSIGAALGDIRGYPNDIEKRGKAEYLTDTGLAFGGSATIWLGGALSDWLVFGVGAGGVRSQGNGQLVQGYTFLFHTEVFPLFPLGGTWRELGIALDTGAGNFIGDPEDKPADSLAAAAIDSGAASRVGVSLFYDGFRFWKMSTGPYLAFDYTWSATMEQPLFMLGLRTALYSKAVR